MLITDFSRIKEKFPKLEEKDLYGKVQLAEDTINVLKYLPTENKIEFVNFVIDNAFDAEEGYANPIKTNVTYCIGIMIFYAGVQFDEKQNLVEAYDLLEQNHIIDMVLNVIPEDEKKYISQLVDDSVKSMERFNNSAAGIIKNMSSNAGILDERLQKILSEIKSKDNPEIGNGIRDIVGKIN